jgi:hypothetical protein
MIRQLFAWFSYAKIFYVNKNLIFYRKRNLFFMSIIVFFRGYLRYILYVSHEIRISFF